MSGPPGEHEHLHTAQNTPLPASDDPFSPRAATPATASTYSALPAGAGAPSIRPVPSGHNSYEGGLDEALAPPAAPFGTRGTESPVPSGADSNRGSAYYPSSPVAGESNPFLTPNAERGALSPRDSTHLGAAEPLFVNEKALDSRPQRKGLLRRPICWIITGVVAVVVIVAVVVPVVLIVGKKSSSSSGGSSSGGKGSSSNPQSPTGDITGGDGSTVITANGSFTYKNQFGGFWYQDPNDPFANNAQCNSWTKPLNQSWDWVNDKIYGVNLGGWFVLEPFITPSFYQIYNGSVDEWTLSVMMANDTANGGLSQIEQHYATFITEEDIAQIAGAGLNWVRVPIPFWAIDVWNDEPFLAKTAWKYILRLFDWCRKYGIRINLDLHTIPGSQNGYNHSGRLGSINWLLGAMGVANAQRSLQYIRTIAEFISQPEYENLIPMFGMVNEPLLGDIGLDALTRFYLQAHDTIRSITGIGKGPFLSIHDGFQGNTPWVNFLRGSDRIAMDTHPYFAFGGAMTDPFINGTGAGAGGVWPAKACQSWGGGIVQSQQDFGVTIAGEFSAGWNDCGLFLHGVGDQSTAYPGDCSQWTEWQNYSQEQKDGLNNFVSASMDALQNWFFWTWKIGNSTAGTVETPMWSYKLGLENGWMPTDPRTSAGKCADHGVLITPFNNSYQSWQTGGASAGTIEATSVQTFGQWPPPTISGVSAIAMSDVPTYTQTAPANTLPMPTYTNGKGKTVSVSDDGWAQPTDTAGGVTTVADCVYPDPWTIGTASTASCTGSGQASMGSAAIASVPITSATTATAR